IGQRFAEYRPEQPPLIRNVGWRYAGIHRTQTIAVGAPKESERSDHRAGADTGHQFERWHRATIGPATEQSGAECTVLAAARDCQKIRRGKAAIGTVGSIHRRTFALESPHGLA